MRYDYLIVGQGLAGSTLAYNLIKKGKRVLVFDEEKENSSSKLAAGIINPVTGRRFVKSWKFDAFFEKAKTYYQQFEKVNNVSVFKELEIYRALFSHEEQHDFLAKMENESYARYLNEIETSTVLSESFKKSTTWISVNGARLDFNPYLVSIRNRLISLDFYRAEYFDTSSLQKQDSQWIYKSEEFDKVVFCEGFKMRNNPFFDNLPTVPAKGDILIVKVPDLQADKIYKHKCFLVPLSIPQTFWVGSTYEWNFKDEFPSEDKRKLLLDKLDASLNLPYKVISHKAAVRPTGKDRRPYLGTAENEKNLYIFNSFGTKGASLIPYWTEKMIDFMEDGIALDKDVDIERLID